MLATVGNLRVQSPVAQGGVTAIGLHGSEDGALVLKPVGPQVNEGLLARLWRRITGATRSGLAWYQLSEGRCARSTSAPSREPTSTRRSTEPSSRIRDQIISAARSVPEIELRPVEPRRRSSSRSRTCGPIPSLTVGANVAAGSSKLGTVTDISRFERQALERYAADGGNNVAIQVFPSATLGVP